MQLTRREIKKRSVERSDFLRKVNGILNIKGKKEMKTKKSIITTK